MFKKLLLVCFSVVGLMGCAQLPKAERTPKVTFSKEATLGKVVVTKTELKHITLEIQNTSNDILEVVWKESSINNSAPFITGQKYADSTAPMPNAILAPTSDLTVEIYPSNSIYHDQYWNIKDLKYPANVVLKLKQGTKEEFVVIKVDSVVTEQTK